MSVQINLTSTSSDLVDYLGNTWLSNFTSPTYGDFYQDFDPGDSTKIYTQWAAGSSTTSGILLDGSFTYEQGDLDGTTTSLDFGATLSGSGSTGFSLPTTDLSIDLTGANGPTAVFDYAIYDLSVNGSLAGFYDYFAAEGTEQIGTSGNDVLTSFDGDDVLTGNAGSDTFVFSDGWANDTITDFDGSGDIIDLSGVAGITSYADLVFNHTNSMDFSGVLTITDGTDTIEVDGYTGYEVWATLDASDFIFV